MQPNERQNIEVFKKEREQNSKEAFNKVLRSKVGERQTAPQHWLDRRLLPSHWHLLQLASFTSMKLQKLKMASCLKILSICSQTRRKRILF